MSVFDDMNGQVRVPYALRRLTSPQFTPLLPCPEIPRVGDVALAEVEKVSKNASIELSNGRRCAIHEGATVAVVFGNRYATLQFEGYARREGSRCDLLSMGGLCGLVASRHAKVTEPTRLRLLGGIGDAHGRPLRLQDFRLPPVKASFPTKVMVVCGSSMDSGKTHTVMSAIVGLRRQGARIAGIKLTGTATGKDTWNMLDAGACVAFDFVDGGFPSTYLSSLDELLTLHGLLTGHARAHAAEWVVIEIADGLLQTETAALLQSAAFRATVDAWVFAAGDPMAAESGVRMLREWNIAPVALAGIVSMSPLGMREAEAATGMRCYTAREIQDGALNPLLPSAGVWNRGESTLVGGA
jgi:hypothetical protein